MLKADLMRKLSVSFTMSRQICWLSQNILHKLCLKLLADHVRPRPQSDREPVLPRFGGKPRAPVGAGILASLTHETSGLRAPANTLLKSCAEGFSGSAVASPPSSSGSGGIVGSV